MYYAKSPQIDFIIIYLIYRKPSTNTTLIITVELFVTMARLAQGQTSVIMVKIGARWVKIRPAIGNSSHGKKLILQFNPMCKKICFIR